MGLLFKVGRPASYWDVVVCHLLWGLLSGAILLAAFSLPLDKIPVRLCAFLRLTGYPCFSCGWTRGFVSIANGNWLSALHDCPLAAVLFWGVALIFAWNTAALMLGRKIGRGSLLRLSGKRGLWIAGWACLTVLLNWIYRLAMGLK